MYEQGFNVYTNFPYNPNFTLTQKVRAAIVGYCGNGKTSFINKLCNVSNPTGMTSNSLTRDIAYEEVVLPRAPPNLFIVYDTPGTNSNKLAMQHALVIRRTLTGIDLNLILIQSKFDSRYELTTLPELKRLSKIFAKQKDINIVFLVSHVDILDNIPAKETKTKKQVIEQFGNQLKRNNINHKLILYSNYNSNPELIGKILYSQSYKVQLKKLQIPDELFYKYFKIQDINVGLDEDDIIQYLEELEDVVKLYFDYLKEIPNSSEENDDKISELKAFMKYDLKKLQENQFAKYQDLFPLNFAADLYLLISQKIQNQLERFDDKSNVKIIKKYYYQYDKKQYDVRDLLKACSQCGTIWMRSDGCDGATTCGNKPGFFDFFSHKKQSKYRFERKAKKILMEKSQLKQLNQKQIKDHSEKTIKPSKKEVQTKNRGCGARIVWRDLSRLPDIEKRLFQLYGISNYAEIKSDVDFLNKINQNRAQEINRRVQLNAHKLEQSRRL